MNREMIKRGTTIYAKKPFVFALHKEYRTTRCDNCLKSGKLLKCSSCRYVYYCDRNCQKESWSIHKAECPQLKKVLTEWKYELPDIIRLMARIILKLNQGGGDEVDYYTETNFRKFEDLMSHESDIKEDESRIGHCHAVCLLVREFLGETQMPNFEELIGIYGKIVINLFEIGDSYYEGIATHATGIYLGPSVIDHSCKPNTIVTFERTTMIIRTLVDLPCLDWSQITISYLYTEMVRSNKDRRERLHRSFYFWCYCERCKQPDPMTEAAACPNLLCDSPCQIYAEECEKCGIKLSKKFKEIFLKVTDFTVQSEEKIKTNFDLGKICLEKQKNVLYKFNIQHVRTLMAILYAAMQSQCWEEATLYCKELIPAFLLYYGEVHPSVGIIYFTMGKLYMHLEKSKEALDMLTKARSVLMITHGDKHSLVREDLHRLFQLVLFKINMGSIIQDILNM